MLGALAKAEAAAPAREGRPRGRGGNAAPWEASTHVVVSKMVPILISLDRRIAIVEDRASFVITLKKEAATQNSEQPEGPVAHIREGTS